MQSRQTLLEIFSTFLQFDTNSIGGWVSDSRLRRSMQTCLDRSSHPDLSEDAWALFWHRVWQSQSHDLAVNHLTAYLQETCYKVSKRLMTDFSSGDSLTDFFQIAIVRIPNILKGFNPQQNSNLKVYASLAFRNAITDTLRQRQIADVCTTWGLLTKVSQKRLIESLQYLGYPQDTLNSYVFAWKCFNAIYAPIEGRTTRQLPKPNSALWLEITDFYNRERISALGPSAPACLPNGLEGWLTECGKAVRAYLYPTLVSLDALKFDSEGGGFVEELPIPFQESLLANLIEQEEEVIRSTQQAEINAVLLRALVKLDLQAQRLLKLYYGQELTQQQIAQQLNMKQYTVSRRLSSLRQSLLLALGKWSQKTLHQSLNSDLLNNMSPMLEEWLKTHYHSIE